MTGLTKHWQRISWLSLLLWPLSLVFCFLVFVRQSMYRLHWKKIQELPVPVIVVGNITVGGTGKTPLVIWLCRHLQKNGYRPGVIVHGYRGQAKQWPQLVQAGSPVTEVGDEAVLLARRCDAPVAAGPDRVASAKLLAQQHGCDLILSDDGLQHYALARTIEIAVIDGSNKFGNGFCLPAGPLREKPSRLQRVDLCITNGLPQHNEYSMAMKPGDLYKLAEPSVSRAVTSLAKTTVHAVAGIGNPDRFFSQLETLGARPIGHIFPDHHFYQAGDLRFEGPQHDIIMTEKDAVKCEQWADDCFWVMPIVAQPDKEFGSAVLNLLKEKTSGQKAA